jgi:hypothetical protein
VSDQPDAAAQYRLLDNGPAGGRIGGAVVDHDHLGQGGRERVGRGRGGRERGEQPAQAVRAVLDRHHDGHVGGPGTSEDAQLEQRGVGDAGVQQPPRQSRRGGVPDDEVRAAWTSSRVEQPAGRRCQMQQPTGGQSEQGRAAVQPSGPPVQPHREPVGEPGVGHLGIHEFALLCVGIRNRPAHPIDDALLCVGVRNSPPHLAHPGPAGPLTR